ncbi:MAG: hypothetical protein C4541_05005 [Candidatus Auribacter fodinae]|jgi:endonuclease YncB( thermonuclease family)|uniref:TNase-like domain-containing protein n=1 Tax=Candidatus Auribacter fodinae TaxID=2093366 RepID=A0A3A4R5S2_9BACT|nr:MAG: hypothetical protein C4541_05005 [Candidatus Auribacter fodinae]
MLKNIKDAIAREWLFLLLSILFTIVFWLCFPIYPSSLQQRIFQSISHDGIPLVSFVSFLIFYAIISVSRFSRWCFVYYFKISNTNKIYRLTHPAIITVVICIAVMIIFPNRDKLLSFYEHYTLSSENNAYINPLKHVPSHTDHLVSTEDRTVTFEEFQREANKKVYYMQIESIYDGEALVCEGAIRDPNNNICTNSVVCLIGVDAPILHHPRIPPEPFAQESKHYLQTILPIGEEVTLEYVRSDQYGRMLCYVYRKKDGLFVNAEMLSAGLAKVSNEDFERIDEFKKYEQEAKKNGYYIWSNNK